MMERDDEKQKRRRGSLKGHRLGKFDKQPMTSTTLALHGLTPKDAVEVVDRKIHRALAAGAEHIRILPSPEEDKVRKAVLAYLESCEYVREVVEETGRAGAIAVALTAIEGS